MEWLVMDVTHTFHNIPIRPCKRHFMRGNVGTRFLFWKVLGMEGKSSPKIWGWIAAAIGRVVSSVFSGDEFRCAINVDDPFLAAGGSLGERLRPGIRPCLSAPTSQLKTSASQWPFQKTSLMPCTARRPGSTVSRKKVSDYSAASFPLLLVRSRHCGPSLTWTGRRCLSRPRLLLELVHCRRFPVALWLSQAHFSEVPCPLVTVFPVAASWCP